MQSLSYDRSSAACVPSPAKVLITHKGVYLPISKLHWILAAVNLLAQNNISQICYSSQISLHSVVVNCRFFANLTPLGEHLFC